MNNATSGRRAPLVFKKKWEVSFVHFEPDLKSHAHIPRSALIKCAHKHFLLFKLKKKRIENAFILTNLLQFFTKNCNANVIKLHRRMREIRTDPTTLLNFIYDESSEKKKKAVRLSTSSKLTAKSCLSLFYY